MDAVIILAGCLAKTAFRPDFLLSDLLWLTVSYTLITTICLYIFSRGQKKDQAEGTMHLIIAFSLKLILELVLALLWFFAGKKNTPSSLLLFFMLYLAFTLYATIAMLNTLKTRSLENKN